MTTVITPINTFTDDNLPTCLDGYMARTHGIPVDTKINADGTHWVTRTINSREIHWDKVSVINSFIAGFRAAKATS